MTEPDKKTVHVLHVVPSLGVGGLQVAMARVVNALGHQGMRHSICALKGQPEIRNLLDPSVKIFCMNARPHDPTLPFRLARLIRTLNPTVIHARNWSAWPDITLARALTGFAQPLIFSFHGVDSTRPLPLLRRLAWRALASLTTHIFTVSTASKAFLAQKMGLHAGRIHIIPNGVDTEHFSPSQHPSTATRLVIGTVGSLNPIKNQALLIRAFASLIDSGIDAELRLAGSGPLKQELLALAESLSVADRLRFSGHVQNVPEFLRDLNIFTLSSDSEAHPNALLEAMACGLPCLATDVGGVKQVLDSGACGLLAEPGNVAQFADALKKLAANPTLREKLGRSARNRVCTHYSLTGMIKSYDDLYHRLTAALSRQPAATSTYADTQRPPRILMLGPTSPSVGGMATVVQNLCDSDLSKRCRLTVLNTGKNTPQNRSLFQALAANLSLLLKLSAAILSEKPQFVHIHTCSGFTFWRDCSHMLLARLLGCRVLWHIHGGYFADFASNLPAFARTLLRHALQMSSSVIVLSNGWRKRLQQFSPRARWHVVPNGVPIPAPVPRDYNEPVQFLFLGNMDPQKGAPDLISATTLACRAGFSGTVNLAGGETAPGQLRQIQQAIDDSACSSRFRLLATIDDRQRAEQLAHAQCLVLPSYAEGLPMAILEAMACGLPIITTTVGAIPEVITDGLEGFLIEPGDIQALADRMIQLENNADLRRRMARAGRTRAEKHYSLQVMVQKLMQIYTELLEQ